MRLRAGALLATLPLLGLALAGCTGGGPSSSQPATRTQECPAWQVGLHSFVSGQQRYDSRLDEHPTNDTFPEAQPALVDNGHALDRIYIFLQPDAGATGQSTRGITATDMRVTMSFFRADTHEPLQAYDMSKGPPGTGNLGSFHWTFGPSEAPEQKLLMVRLTQPPSMPDPQHPSGITVEYTYQTNLDGNNDTPSLATIDYKAIFEYRVC